MSARISHKTRDRIGRIIRQYPRKEAAMLPVLHAVQREVGRITEEDEQMIADILSLPPVRVKEVVTFYSMFHQKKIGRHHIQVCSNLSCFLKGGDNILDHLQAKLGIGPGETSEDGKFSLSLVECLGACEQAPCMMINDDYYGHLDPIKIDEILKDLK
ncbi:MAG: NADH-quinone oxidoreductase subunit NuoE [Candidatus Aminicenantes bacterium]